MRPICFIALGSWLICAAAVAEEIAISDSRRAKIEEIMRLQGLNETFEQIRASGRERSTTVLEDQFAKTVASNPKVSTDTVLEARLLMRKTLDEIEGSWTFEEALDVYALHYGRALSDEELDQVIAYWSSPTGQREMEASRAAVGPFMEFIRERSERAYVDTLDRYQEELKVLLEKERSSRQ